jgi:cystathionine beta-lyase/cystathionine gamma-synthase
MNKKFARTLIKLVSRGLWRLNKIRKLARVEEKLCFSQKDDEVSYTSSQYEGCFRVLELAAQKYDEVSCTSSQYDGCFMVFELAVQRDDEVSYTNSQYDGCFRVFELAVQK